MSVYLGIEIGGTKLQLGVGANDGQLVRLERRPIDASGGAGGIQRQLDVVIRELRDEFEFAAAGVGFGGPVDRRRGVVTTSHQVNGWDDFPLRSWLEQRTRCPVRLGNDCDCAALAEARWGAGRGVDSVFYVTVGTGIGGGWVSRGESVGDDRPAIAEIGHLRPLPFADPPCTVENISSGWGIADAARSMASQPSVELRDAAAQLLETCGGRLDQLTGEHCAAAAEMGNRIALEAVQRAVDTLGWAIAQVITISAANVVVVGGGVSMMPASLFFTPLRERVAEFVFPPLAGSYEIKRAELGEGVVVHGAIAVAQQ
ncbi:MAG: ROK family protein [Pirellulaceae bacterium]|jgi:glucokinase|nr:ROK family protein [Pirellulaceae bacterium]MDP7020059.1 ROK family protein [Pirellulaceae bacterium]